MIFKKLELKNFKSHLNTTITFNRGISLIIGENGAGKSSIFEAISFALFKDSNVKLVDLVRSNKGVNDRIEMGVKLTFNSNGVDYRVERSVVKNNDTAKSAMEKLIKITDVREETVASKTTEVNREIEQILSMDSSTFLNAIHIKQGQISELFDKTAAERKELIGQLLKLDDLENAFKRIPEITKEKISDRDYLSGKIINETELNNDLRDVQKEQKILMEKDEIFNNHFEEIKRELETKTKEKESLDQLKDKFSKTCMEKVHQEDNLNKLKESNDKLNSDLNKIIEDEKLMENLKPYCDKFDIFKEFKDSFLIFKNLKKEESRKNEVLERINENKEILLKEKENHDRFIELNAEIDQLKINEAQLVSEVKHAHDLENKKNEIINEISQVNKSMNDFYDNISDILSHLEIENPIDSIKNNQDLTDLDNIVKRHSEDYENKINQIDDDLKELNDEKVRLAQQSESIQEPLSNIKEVENKCPTCQSEISDDKKEELIRDYETTILNNNHRISEIDKLIDDLIIKKSSINEHSDDLKSILSNSKKMEIYINQADKLDGELEKIQAQISESQDMKLKLEELQPTLKSKVEESERLKINHDNYIKAQTLLDSLDDEIKVKKELETINLDIEKNEEDLKRIIDLDSKLSLQITEEELNEKINFLSKKQSDYDFLKGSVTRRERVEKDIKSNEDEIDSMIKSIEDLSETIESLGYDENNYQKVNKLVETLSNESNTLFTNIEVNRNQLKNIEEKISDIESKIEENKKYIDEFNDLNEYIELLNDFRWHYSKDGIQKDLRAQSKPLIQKYTRDFFEKFNFNYSDLILDDDYNISIYGPEGEIKLDMVSGGEEIAIALSLRLGITQVMSKGMIETILLDEPTIHLDQYRKQELIDVLRSMTVIPQMIIVTHDSELEPAADSIIKVKKENGISKVDDS